MEQIIKANLFYVLFFKREVDRNQDLLGRIKRLEEKEGDAAKNLSEQSGNNKVLRKNFDDLNKKVLERDVRLNTANQVNTKNPDGVQGCWPRC